jgi:hypothetical protein
MELFLSDPKDKEIFKKLLRCGIVIFEYTKKDATKRHASGTLYPKLLRERVGEYTPTDNEKKGNNAKPTQLTYWDLTMNGWRSPHLVGQKIKIKDFFAYNDIGDITDKKQKRVIEINNRLQEIYDTREVMKKKKKEYVYMLNYIKATPDSNTVKKSLHSKLDLISTQRKELRTETKTLKKEKSELLQK